MVMPLRTVRLRKHADYTSVYGASRKHSSTSLSFFYREQPRVTGPLSTSRFGITVPRAIGPAVLRNRIKRRLRVVTRAALATLPHGVDIVLHPRPSVAVMPIHALRTEINAVFATIARRLAAGAVNSPLPRPTRARGKAPKPLRTQSNQS